MGGIANAGVGAAGFGGLASQVPGASEALAALAMRIRISVPTRLAAASHREPR
jgi:hypothetical protein